MDGSDKYIGRILDNRYEILELIGTGGMALVYKARCHRLNRYVAIKILKEELASDEEFRRRFHTESQAVGMLSHPNIVAVYDVSRSENIEYIVMELIEGITLKQYINRKGPLNWKEALHFTTLVTKALSHAHSRGIIHRDIKPHNIMILKDGSIKVADFGIARLLTMQNTLTQEALGSVHYISPEQAKGGYVDARSDIYSLGVVMYEMLTSRLPFVGESAVSVAIQHISAIPLRPGELNPEIPAGLEDITMHAMESDLNNRFTTADEMLEDLETFRKNPSKSFKYSRSEKKEKPPAAADQEQETKIINSVADISAIADGGITTDRMKAAKQTEQRARKPVTSQQVKRPAVRKKPEMSSSDFRAVKKRAASTSTLIGVFLIILFLIAIMVFMWNYLLRDLFGPQSREQIEIVNFVNRVYEDLVNDELYAETYSFRTPIRQHSNDVEAGLVISQIPEARTRVDAPIAGSKINVVLTVSSGPEPAITMPNLLNQHFRMAKNALDSLNFDLEIKEDPVESEIEKGYVISTIPEAGAPLSRGYTVTIVYSAGIKPDFIEVPNLVGKTKAQVESAFRSLGITPSFEYYESEAPEGIVTFIEKAGLKITLPATIVVHVSKGPPETPTPEPTDTPTPEPTETPTPEPTESPSPEPTESPVHEPPPHETPPVDPGETPLPAESPDLPLGIVIDTGN